MRSHRVRGWALVGGVMLYAWLSLTDWTVEPNAEPNLASDPPPPLLEPDVARPPEPEPTPPIQRPEPSPVNRVTPTQTSASTRSSPTKQRYVDRFDLRRNDY